MATQQSRAYQPLIFGRGVDPGNCSYDNHFHSGGEKCYHALELLAKSRQSTQCFPLGKVGGSTKFTRQTNIAGSQCRINLKISGRSKINIFGIKRDNDEFLHKMMGLTSLHDFYTVPDIL